MRLNLRRSVAVGAATVLAGVGLAVGTGAPANAAEAPCPAQTLCVYDNTNFTGLLSTSTYYNVMLYGPEMNDRISSVINNTTVVHAVFFEHASFRGWGVYVPPGTSWSAPPEKDNQISSLGIT